MNRVLIPTPLPPDGNVAHPISNYDVMRLQRSIGLSVTDAKRLLTTMTLDQQRNFIAAAESQLSAVFYDQQIKNETSAARRLILKLFGSLVAGVHFLIQPRSTRKPSASARVLS